jgi:hypothetical protein
MTETKDDSAAQAAAPRVANALDKWKAEAGYSQAPLTEARLDASKKYIIPFTTDVGEVKTHYLVGAPAVAQAAQDIGPTSGRFPLEVVTEGDPPRRRAVLAAPAGQEPVTALVAQGALDQLEADVVLQAAGRVRPFTRARGVITMHPGELPGVRYTVRLAGLREARAFFGVPTPSQTARAARAEQARRLRAGGMSLVAVAARLKVSIATIKRDLRAPAAHPAS